MGTRTNTNAIAARVPGRGAFTLIELGIVLLLMSILAAVAVPRWVNGLQSFRADTAAHRIAADLALAQSTAYSSSASRTVTFSVANNRYVLDGVAPLNRSTGTYAVSLADYPYRSTLVSVWGQATQQSITFDGFGKPSRGGTIVVAAGGAQKSIVVSSDTGNVVIQ